MAPELGRRHGGRDWFLDNVESPQINLEYACIVNDPLGSAQRLAERKKEIGSIKFNCLYLLDPSGLEGTLFKRDWLTFFEPSILTPHPFA